jgi:hypothetical protein
MVGIAFVGELVASCDVLGPSTPGTVGHWLRSKILGTTSSLKQTARKLYTTYRIWSHHS